MAGSDGDFLPSKLRASVGEGSLCAGGCRSDGPESGIDGFAACAVVGGDGAAHFHDAVGVVGCGCGM